MLEAERRGEVLRFLERHGISPDRLEPLTGDVSARRYLRVHAGEDRYVVASYPVEMREVVPRFLASTRLLTEAGVRVPHVLAVDHEDGWMLLEDVGDATLEHLLDREPTESPTIYRRCSRLIDRIVRLPRQSVRDLNPPLGGERLFSELESTWKGLLEPLGLVGSPSTARRFRRRLSELCGALGSAPLVPCHRDFMVRNLVWCDGEIVVLDHQDLRLGPPTYDLASLLNDTRFASPAVEAEILDQAGIAGEDLGDYRRAVVQRALKAAGTFARAARGGNPHHVGLIAPTLARAWRHFETLPELRDVHRTLRPAWREYLERAHLLE